MRILLTNTGPWGTGSFTVAKGILEEFLHLGHEVKLFFPDQGLISHDLEDYYKRSDVYEIWKFPISRGSLRLDSFPLIIPDPHPRNPIARTFLQLSQQELALYFDSFQEHITPLIQEFKPDIIECQHLWAFDHIIHKMGLDFFACAHHSDQMGFLYDKRMQSYAIESAQKAKAIFAVSSYVKQEVIDLYNVDAEKVHVLANGYDRHVFRVKHLDRHHVLHKLKIDIPKGTFLVSFAGKLSKTKGVDIILRANQYLSENENIHILLVGAGDINRWIQENDIPPECYHRVHFVGHVAPYQLAEIHQVADLYIMPSRSEGFGIACLEAMACGLPTIVTRSGCLEHFAVGEVIEKENPKQLAEAILRMKHMPRDQLKAIGEKARQKAETYSWLAIAKERLKIYSHYLKHS